MMDSGHYVTLLRHTHWPTGTYGEMMIGDKQILTCECPWLNNVPNKSCIPEGGYEVVRHESPRYGWCFALVGDGVTIHKVNDRDRWGILIHTANWADQLQGCIAPGMFLSPMEVGGRVWPRNMGVGRSRQAMGHIMDVMPDVWHLHITHAESRA